VLVVSGEADLHVAPELRSAVLTVLDRGVTSLVIDLARVTFVDSTTLGVLLSASRRAKAAGGDVRVVISSREIRRLFELTLLDRVISCDPTRLAALAALEPTPAR
jgi:anti-sigma B factor antagonist